MSKLQKDKSKSDPHAMGKRIESLLKRAWYRFAPEFIQLIAEHTGRYHLTRAEAEECITDAHRLFHMGDDEAAKNFYLLPMSAQKRILRGMFPTNKNS
jgi:hypothetical protein